MTQNRVLAIRSCLIAAFEPSDLEVVDESHKHAGHEGAKDGRGHFSVRIISPKFSGRRSIERHRMIYAALGSLMQTDIHALSMQAAASEAELLKQDRKD